jgi:two-component system CheB/CheR fusion protein
VPEPKERSAVATGKSGGPFIVGIGASAGGIEALEALFRAMPEPPAALAFVVVTHLPHGGTSVLPQILVRHTGMPAQTARDGEPVRAGQVYVIPPDAVVTIHHGRLRVRQLAAAEHERYPIDAFLGSLADDQAERAIAVILSGAGSDGTFGLIAVKERGGLTIAQGAGDTAPSYSGMPESAIATGLVDLVLPVEAIPAKLAAYVQSFGRLQALTAESRSPAAVSGKTAPVGKAAQLRQAICTILREQVGHDFAGYKDRTFLRRVQRRMQVLQLTDTDAYLNRLRQEPDEAQLLFRDLLIGVTGFFRDTEAFEALERLAIPRLFEAKGAGDAVRVWVPGCATGEEAYSLAILLREQIDRLPAAPRIQLFATDIDERALAVARTARYPASLLESMKPERRARFFSEDGSGGYALAKPVREMCIFSTHSLIRDPPFSHLDLISCRNLLIYLGSELQDRVIPTFHYALRPGGFLFLGSAEGVGRHGELFQPLDQKSRLFQRRDYRGAPAPLPLNAPSPRLLPAGSPPSRLPPRVEPALRQAVEAQVLEQFAPAHVVVSGDGEVLYFSPRTGKYLEPPPGQPTRQLLAMARKGLRLDLRQALEQAVKTRRNVVHERVAVELDDHHAQLVNLIAAPLRGERGSEPLFLILFDDLGPLQRADEMAAHAHGPSSGAAELERDLEDTRERLQASIEEYETALEELKAANEELVSMNEELQSTNEELETSKEEIQSVNEELQTVNQELGAKVGQLDRANAGLTNLFASTRIGIVFLDRQLAIRSFTPTATEVFSLIPGDHGRPLADIATRLDHPRLHHDIVAAVSLGQEAEARVATQDGGAHYLLRILPYRNDGRVEGAILTFVNITAMAKAERQHGAAPAQEPASDGGTSRPAVD